ncbi:MAG: uroporphyrinogen-III C-methyltransferase [Xanthobacteraceae bacterium]|nr:MAG: uroporphyrinogen-III C-methyltransferase [Xanthobacteraceae bacterium]
MDQLPIFLNVAGRPVVVLGGGAQAARRAELALRAGGHVRVFAPKAGEDFRDIRDHAHLTVLAREPAAADVAGAALVFCASGDAAADRRLQALARRAGVPVNVADAPGLCDFIMPAIVDRAPLTIAIGTGGASPVFARLLRAKLESLIPASYGRLVAFASRQREPVGKRIRDATARRRFWEWLLEGPVADRVLEGREAEATAEMERHLAAPDVTASAPSGEVYLVGAGPGDPDLLTFRALRLMQRADVVLYDRLLGDAIMNLVRRDAERIYVGKRSKEHTLSQDEITALMIRLAREGRRVLRLKGGDPFMFGRGGEEIEHLAAAGIAFQIVPGITAANGCAAYAGIPLTHRDHAQACVFVTGHGQKDQVDVDWKLLLQPRQTVVIYMGLGRLAELTREFLAHGADPALPAALIENGTRANQRVLTGTLGTIADQAAAAAIKGPAIIILGTVVTLRDKLVAPD